MNGRFVHRQAFPSLGSEIEILLSGCSEAQARSGFSLAEVTADAWMWTFSRFRPDSELSRLNASAGQTVAVSARLFEAIDLAAHAYRWTSGLFNPLVLPVLAGHGYDRSFDQVPRDRPASPVRAALPGMDEIVLDSECRSVQLPAGGAIDLGGIAKGMYADFLAEQLREFPAGLVSAGGDLRIWGKGPDDGGWAVGVENPVDPNDDVAAVVLRGGALATSGTNRRTWRRGEGFAHHLIDPRTGKPADSPLRSLTVAAPTAAIAEIASTACFIDPESRGCERLLRQIWARIAVDHDGSVTCQRSDPEAPINVFFNS